MKKKYVDDKSYLQGYVDGMFDGFKLVNSKARERGWRFSPHLTKKEIEDYVFHGKNKKGTF